MSGKREIDRSKGESWVKWREMCFLYVIMIDVPLTRLPSTYPIVPTGFSASMLGINSSSAGTYNASSGGGSTEEKDENSGTTMMGSPNGGSKKSGKGEKSKKGKKAFVRVKDGEEESGS